MDRSPFDTDDAFEGGYGSLEERAYEEEIDSDEAVRTTIRLRGWQQAAIDRVKDYSGTNQVEVIYSAYMEGLSCVRDVVERERIKELGKLRRKTSHLASDFAHHGIDENEMFSRLNGDDIPDPMKDNGTVGSPLSAYFKFSAKSEVKDTFEVDANFGPWIHRSLIALGLETSDNIGTIMMNRIAENKEAISGMYEKSRLKQEQLVKYIITENYSFWTLEGIKRGQMELIRNILPLMTTKHRHSCEQLVEGLEECAEVIEE
jgi:hypothetical protein